MATQAIPVTPAAPAVVLTIWTALVLYVAGEYGRSQPVPAAWVRPVWLLGALVYLAHVAAAFGIHHAWSHAAAYDYTAARTEAFLGIAWGGGLWANYAFTAVWVAEGVWWRFRPASHARRSPAWTTAIRSVFFFMIANGAVVFVDSSRRLLGVAILAALVWIWRRDAPAGSILTATAPIVGKRRTRGSNRIAPPRSW